MNVALTLMQQHWKARNAFDAYVIVPGPRVAAVSAAAVSAAVGAAAAAVETVAFAVAETEAVAVAAAAPQHAS